MCEFFSNFKYQIQRGSELWICRSVNCYALCPRDVTSFMNGPFPLFRLTPDDPSSTEPVSTSTKFHPQVEVNQVFFKLQKFDSRRNLNTGRTCLVFYWSKLANGLLFEW